MGVLYMMAHMLIGNVGTEYNRTLGKIRHSHEECDSLRTDARKLHEIRCLRPVLVPGG